MNDPAQPTHADVPLSGEALASWPLDEVRTARAALIEEETGLSYLRRLVQGPLDIVRGERARRGAGEGSDLTALVDALPSLLADGTRAGGLGRAPQRLEPTRVDPDLVAELDALLAGVGMGGGGIAEVTTAGDDALDALAVELGAFERRVSARRRLLQDRIDALQGELTRRYRTGEASVESLLD